MASDKQFPPKKPTNLSSQQTPCPRDGDDAQRSTAPRASAGLPATPLSGLERVRMRRLQTQQAMTGGNTRSVDPFVDVPPRSARSGRVSSPNGMPRDMGMSMGGARTNGDDMGTGMSSNDPGLQQAPSASLGPSSAPKQPTHRTTYKSAYDENQEEMDREVAKALLEEELENADYPYTPRKGVQSTPGNGKQRGSTGLSFEQRDGKKAKERALPPIHRPKKEKGARAIGPVDQLPAIQGQHDPSKLLISFATEKPDPKHPGHWIPSKHVSYDLSEIDPRTFDFDNAEHIKRINVWRRQILGRNFEKQRKTRSFWLEIEKEYVVHLAKKQLEGSNRVKWNRLANEYNERFHGRTQRMGERLLTQGRQNLGVLLADRPAPWRTAAAIQGMAAKWQDVREMIREAEKRGKVERDEEDSDESESEDDADEEEIPDPNLDPEPGVTPRKYGAYGKKNRGKEKANAKKVKVEAESEEKIESESEVDNDEVLM